MDVWVGTRAFSIHDTTLVEVASVRLCADTVLLVSFCLDVLEVCTYMADMEDMSKPKRPPPIMDMAAII